VRPERRVKMTRLRLRIAERLKSAQNTYAMLSTFNEIDMTNVMELRNAYKARGSWGACLLSRWVCEPGCRQQG
jgi:pyruvate/2-oxoglutarate dehydrogenase complex dihydrolipoamide acyltransferase (E2) component